jgi:hypothetical protein
VGLAGGGKGLLGVVSLVFVLLVVTYLLVARAAWLEGKIICQSESDDPYRRPKIVVRELHGSSLLANILGDLDDSPFYRCEFYWPQSKMLYSAQTHQMGEYSKAKQANVVWWEGGGATVYIDNTEVFDCSRDGVWSGRR